MASAAPSAARTHRRAVVILIAIPLAGNVGVPGKSEKAK